MANKREFRFEDRLLNHIKFFRNKEVKSVLDETLAKRFDGLGTLLHHAAYCDNVEIVERLIEVGSDINFRGEKGRTALMLAVENERLSTVKVLLKAGAELDIADAEGRSVLQMVFHEDYFDTTIIEIFLRELQAKLNNDSDLIIALSKCNCAPRHAIILRNISAIHELLAWTKHKYFWLDKEIPTALQQDLTTIFICLELDDNLNDRNAEEVTDAVNLTGYVLLHSKETDRFVFYSRHFREHGVFPTKFTGFTYRHFGCWDESESQFWHASNNTKALIAHLAMLEKWGKSNFKTAKCLEAEWYAGETVFTEKYHELCQEILNKSMFQNSTLLDLLSDQHDQIRKFVRNETFATTIEEVCSELQLSKFFPYYYKTLMLRIKRANEIVKQEDEALQVISKIFSSSYNKCYHFSRQVVGYLNKQELERLCLARD